MKRKIARATDVMAKKACTLLSLFAIIVLLSVGNYRDGFGSDTKDISSGESLQGTLNDLLEEKTINGGNFCIYDANKDFYWQGAVGFMKNNSQYSIASITKMYTCAVIINLDQEGKLHLDDPIKNYLSKEIMKRLHVYKGKDYSSQISIRQLLSHTSGLPDYFTQAPDGKESIEELRKKHDMIYDLNECLKRSRSMTPKFVPGTKGAAFLLGYELSVARQDYRKCYRELFGSCLWKIHFQTT